MQDFKFDVSISYVAKDVDSINELAGRLAEKGLRVNAIVSDSIENGNIDEAHRSRILISTFSENISELEWLRLEGITFHFRDASNDMRRFVPVRLDSVDPPDSVKSFAYLEWRDKTEEEFFRIYNTCISPRGAKLNSAEESHPCVEPLALERSVLPVVGVEARENYILVSTVTGVIEKWDVDLNRKNVTKLKEDHASTVWSLSVKVDGSSAIVGTINGELYLFSPENLELNKVVPVEQATVWAIKHLAGSNQIAVGSSDGIIGFYDLDENRCIHKIVAHEGPVYALALSPDGTRIASSSRDGLIKEWDLTDYSLVGEHRTRLVSSKGKEIATRSLVYTDDSSKLISGSADGAIRLWGVESGRLEAILEGHTRGVRTLKIHKKSGLLLSGGQDKTVRIWDWLNGVCIGELVGAKSALLAMDISPNGQCVYAGGRERDIAKWDVSEVLANYNSRDAVSGSKRYTNAKVLLVGDSGVGKTGLAYRLATEQFQPSISTDGVWATQLKIEGSPASTIDREIWLWDFAGQADYRLIHQLYMDETATAILVFNPQSDVALEGLAQWDRDLERAARREIKKILVAGRVDRGGLTISRSLVDEFRESRGFLSFIETSAVTGTGCAELRLAIESSINWNDTPWISSPRIFRLLKNEIIKLRDSGKILLRMSELKQQIELQLPDERFGIEQLRAVTGLLAGPGIVWSLEFGDFVLLQPERMNSYAAAVIRSVRSHAEEIGCISEDAVLNGMLDFQDMERLSSDDEDIVLRAMHQTFVDHGLCLREHTESGTVLIFPSYFKRERPELTGHPVVLVTYGFSGQVDEIYATLVVKLHHTSLVERDKLWRFAADFKSGSGKRLGIRVRRDQQGNAELDVYFEPTIPIETQVSFIRYVHDHISSKAVEVTRRRHYVCLGCHEPVENQRAIQVRLEKGLTDIICSVCESRVSLWDVIEEKYASEDTKKKVRDLEEIASIAIDNESRELILEGHARAITGEAGQIYRGYTNSDHGIDGEIEFKNEKGEASGKRFYVQLKSGDSYLYTRKGDGAEIFTIKKPRWAEYWIAQAYPVILIIRNSDATVRWMNVTDYIRKNTVDGKLPGQVIFKGESFSALSLRRAREKILFSEGLSL